MPRIVVVANETSRWLSVRGPVRDIVLAPRPRSEVIATRSLDELAFAAAQLAASPPDIIVLAGGDGTYGAGVTALARAFGAKELPVLAFAPAGTTCTVARNWSSRRGGLFTAGSRMAAHQCRVVLDDVASGRAHAVSRPTLRVSPDRIAFIVGAGLVARFFEVYERAGAGGYRTAAAITMRVFGGSFTGGALARDVLTPVPCAVEVDGVPAPFEEVSLLVASVVPDLGLSLRLTYRAGEERERFHVVASPLGPRALGPQMPRVLAARPLRGPRVDALASRLRMRFPAGTGAWVADGDLVREDDVLVEPGPVVRVVTERR